MQTHIFYVSPQGNDNWSGLRPDPSNGDGPFQSLDAASRAVRRARAAADEPCRIEVLLRGGVYQLNQPWLLTSLDGGFPRQENRRKKTHPVVWSAYENETPVVSGGRRIEGPWKTETVNGCEVMVTKLDAVQSGKWNFKQLWVNGERRSRPSLPKKGVRTVNRTFDADYSGAFCSHLKNGSRRFGFEKGEFSADWRNLKDIEIAFFGWWIGLRCGLEAVDESANTAWLDRNSAIRLEWSPGDGVDYRVENIFEALTEPGEWYLDRPTGKLYYYPMPGENVETAEIVAPWLEHIALIERTGHIRLEGITFAHNEWKQPPHSAMRDQSAVESSGAVLVTQSEEVTFSRCRIEHCGAYGLEIKDDSSVVEFLDGVIQDLGAGGIKIWHGCRRNVIADTEIAHGGHIYASGCGIIGGKTTGNRIEHCDIHHFYYTGISLGWTWGYHESDSYGNIVEWNHIHDIGLGRLSDMGGIYLLGHAAGTRLRYNHIHDISCRRYGGWCIYTDEGSTDVLVESNLCYNANRTAYNQHYGARNTIRNNILAYGGDSVISYGKPEDHLGLIFESNILLSKDTPILRDATKDRWTPEQVRFDGNLYWSDAGEVIFNEGQSVSYGTQPFANGYLAEAERFAPLEDLPELPHPPTAEDWSRAKVIESFFSRGAAGTWDPVVLPAGTAELRLLRSKGSLWMKAAFQRAENALPITGAVWTREHAELFLRPSPTSPTILQIGLASDGEQAIAWHGSEAPANYAWKGTARVADDGSSWEAELEIPLDPIASEAGTDSPDWRFLFGFTQLPGNRTFASWQQQGHDPEGGVADPGFVDAANGDFHLKPDSPALKMGFIPFDYSQAGVRKK